MIDFSFNGEKKEWLRVLSGESRPAVPEVQRFLLSIPNTHGYRVGRKTFGVRTLNVPIVLFFDGFNDLQKKKEELARWLVHREAKELVFSDERDRVYLARYSSGLVNFEEFASYALGNITFTCHDPFKYAVAPTIQRFTPVQINNVNNGVMNHGEEVACILRVEFRANRNNYQIRHLPSNRLLRVNWSFINGDVLEFDTLRRVVLINGHVRMGALDLSSRFFTLVSGMNRFTSDTGNPIIAIEIEHRARWL